MVVKVSIVNVVDSIACSLNFKYLFSQISVSEASSKGSCRLSNLTLFIVLTVYFVHYPAFYSLWL